MFTVDEIVENYFPSTMSESYTTAPSNSLNNNRITTLYGDFGNSGSNPSESISTIPLTYETSITFSASPTSTTFITSTTSITSFTLVTSDTYTSLSSNHSSKSSKIMMDSISNNQPTSGKIIGLAIGLPVGIFCLGLVIILGFFYNRRFQYQCNDEKNNNWSLPKIYHTPYSDKYTEKLGKDPDANISYKITHGTNIYGQHILTPKKALLGSNLHANSLEVDYCVLKKSQDNQNIHSNTHFNTEKKLLNAQNSIIQDSQWGYDSPLSRWFLTKSAYLQDQILPSLKTPKMKLKKLNLLSRVTKQHSDDLGITVDERSPILPNGYSNMMNFSSIEDNSKTENKSSIIHISSEELASWNPYSKKTFSESKIKPQTIYTNTPQAVVAPMLESVPPKMKKWNLSKDAKKEFDKDSDSINQTSLDLLLDLNIMPTHSNKLVEISNLDYSMNMNNISSQTLSGIYKVIKKHNPQLEDEIVLNVGEYVKVLKNHTDGYCLVERCGSELLTDDINKSIYLNENRGIVPEICLSKI